MTAPDLDAWLPRPQIRTHHRRASRVAPDVLWAAAERVPLDDARRLRRVVRWGLPDLPADISFRDMFAGPPFTVLEEGPDRLVTGLCGPVWSLRRDYPRLSGADEFRSWDRPGTARVLFAHWVEPAPDGSVLHSAGRAAATDRVGRMRLRAMWTVVGPFEGLVGAEPLPLAVARAEAAAGVGSAGG